MESLELCILAMRYALDDGIWNYPLWMYGMETTYDYLLIETKI